MSRLYIANVGHHRVIFMWRMPEQVKLMQLPIHPRSQIVIPGELSADEIEHIVKQHRPYGMTAVGDITASRAQKGVRSLCYSVDKPVSSARMEALLRNNHVILDAAGKEIRKQLAIVSNKEIEKALAQQDQMQGVDTKVELRKMELTIQRDVKDGEEDASEEVTAEGYRVEQEAK